MLQSYPYPLNRTTVLDEGIHIRLFPSTHRFAIPWREIEVVHRIPHGVRLQLGERSPVRIASVTWRWSRRSSPCALPTSSIPPWGRRVGLRSDRSSADPRGQRHERSIYCGQGAFDDTCTTRFATLWS